MIEICDLDQRKQDCRCSDFAFGRCAEGVAGNKIHVDDLQECIFQCDVSRGLDIYNGRNNHIAIVATSSQMFSTLQYIIFSSAQLFHSFGSCDYLIFHRGGVTHENCHLFGPGHMSQQVTVFYSEQIRYPNRVVILERYPSYFHFPS